MVASQQMASTKPIFDNKNAIAEDAQSADGRKTVESKQILISASKSEDEAKKSEDFKSEELDGVINNLKATASDNSIERLENAQKSLHIFEKQTTFGVAAPVKEKNGNQKTDDQRKSEEEVTAAKNE